MTEPPAIPSLHSHCPMLHQNEGQQNVRNAQAEGHSLRNDLCFSRKGKREVYLLVQIIN
jgi:hypothetical protein